MRSLRPCILALALSVPAAADFFSSADIMPGELSCVTSRNAMACNADSYALSYRGSPVKIWGNINSKYAHGGLWILAMLSSEDLFWSTSTRVDASYSDVVTVEGYSGSGFAQFELDGSLGIGHDLQSSCFSFRGMQCGTWDPVPSGHRTPLLPFESGTVPIWGSLHFYESTDGGARPGGGHYELLIKDVFLWDADMQPLTGYQISYASDVPEPASIVLLGGCLFVVAIRLRTWASKHSR